MLKLLNWRIGLKLFSINIDLIKDAADLYEKGFFHYIELYVIPGSFGDTIGLWQDVSAPIVLHAPHSVHGMNLSLGGQENENKCLFEETRCFADILNVETIIVHGGHSGSIAETIRQSAGFLDPRLVLENKPKMGINGEACVGWSPEDFHQASRSGVFKGFVLDFGHASCAAVSTGVPAMDIVHSFAEFNPKVFHLSDGDPISECDKHQNLGTGGFNITDFLSVIPPGGFLTLETPRCNQNGLEDFVMDLELLSVLSQQGVN